MSAAEPASVYWSYSLDDRAEVERLDNALRRRQVQTYLDVIDDERRRARRDIEQDEVLPEDALQALDGAGRVVVIWTTTAAADPWVRAELAMAEDIGVPVVLMADGTESEPAGGDPEVVQDLEALLDNIADGACLKEVAPLGIELPPGRWTVIGRGVAAQIRMDVSLSAGGDVAGTCSQYDVEKNVSGRWVHDSSTDTVRIDLVSSFGKHSAQTTLRIKLVAEKDGVIEGRDAYGFGDAVLTYRCRRAGD